MSASDDNTRLPADRLLRIDDPLNPPPGLIALGRIEDNAAVAMPIDALSTHMYLCGATGSGKSVLLEWLLYGLAKNDQWSVPTPDGVAGTPRGALVVIDPHGELVDATIENILAFAPERADDIIHLNFADQNFPVALNPLSVTSPAQAEQAARVASEILQGLLNLGLGAAPKAVNYAELAASALAEVNATVLRERPDLHLTLLDIPRFFTDKKFRTDVVSHSTNLSVSMLFGEIGSFTMLSERQQLDHALPIIRTIDHLTTNDAFVNTFGQSQNKVDLSKWIRERKIVLVTLPAITGAGAAATKAIGTAITGMMLSSLTDWGRDREIQAVLAIDEFQNFAGRSFVDILAQARKYGLRGIAVNQVPQDLDPEVLRAVQSNTQSKIVGRLDHRAAKDIVPFLGASDPFWEVRVAGVHSALGSFEFAGNVRQENGTFSGPVAFRGLAPALRALPDGVETDALLAEVKRLRTAVTDRSRLESATTKDLAEYHRTVATRDADVAIKRRSA